MEADRHSTLSSPETGERVVLIVEDEPVLRSSMARGLSRLSNLEVAVAGNVAEGRKLIAALSPRVLLLDLHLPDGSGLELLSELDRCRISASTIFVTAYPQKLEGRLPKRADVTVMEKPVPMAELREVVLAKLGAEELQASPFCLADYLQLAGLSRRTVEIILYQRGERLGSVWVQDGLGYHAEDARGTGLRAFRRLLQAPEVLIECLAAPHEPEMPRTLSQSCEELLLDSTRFFDESAMRGTGSDDDDGPGGVESARETPALESDPGACEDACESFEEHYARGVDALLSHSYAEAYASFVIAQRLGSTTGLETNLVRLRSMGYGES